MYEDLALYIDGEFLKDGDRRELPAIDEVHERLRERIPEQGPATIVHGDYRLDNTIVSAGGDLLAVLDWELSTLGDPLADVGLLSSTGRAPTVPGRRRPRASRRSRS